MRGNWLVVHYVFLCINVASAELIVKHHNKAASSFHIQCTLTFSNTNSLLKNESVLYYDKFLKTKMKAKNDI